MNKNPLTTLDLVKLQADESRLQSLVDRARHHQSEYRYLHTVGVMHVAVTLAYVHGLDVASAAVAGLLHDISKGIEPDRIRADLERWGEALDADDVGYPKTWHGIHAAVAARREGGIDDPDILEAIRLHPTADAGAGPLTRILFLADYCDPTRKIDGSETILALAKRDLMEAFRRALILKMGHVLAKRKSLGPRSIRALDAFLTPGQREEFWSRHATEQAAWLQSETQEGTC